MATPVIPALPPAPTRSDGAVDFSSKADALAAAWPPTIVALNASYVWMAQQVAAAEGYKNAAAASAQTATEQAAIAAGAGGAAAEQVALAAQQVTLATQQAVNAANSAAAAEAAGGLGSIAILHAISLSL